MAGISAAAVLIVVAAAEFGRWNGEDFYETLWRTNAVGTKNVIRLQERLKFRLIHFSSSEVYGDWQIGEDPDGHVQAIEKLLASGVTHVFVHSPQGDQKRVIDFYAREVLPRFRSSR